MTFATFISYTGPDEEDARRCYEALAAAGIPAFFAPSQMRVGQFEPQIQSALRDTRSLTLVVSPRVTHQTYVWAEVKQAQKQGTPILPVVVDAGQPQMWLGQIIRRLNQIRAPNGIETHHLNELVRKVRDVSRAGRVVAVLNMKGGVGKTMLTAHAFPSKFMRDRTSTLLVDLDPQHNLTQFFVSKTRRQELYESSRSVLRLFNQAPEVDAPLIALDGAAANLVDLAAAPEGQRLELAVGSDDLVEYCLDIAEPDRKEEARERFVGNINAARNRYSSIVLDLNPCATFLTVCALDVADHVVVPVRPERYAITGLNLLLRVLERLGKRTDPAMFSTVLNGLGDRTVRTQDADVDANVRNQILASPTFASTLVDSGIPYSAILRSTNFRAAPVTPLSLTAERLPRVGRTFRDSLYNVASSVYRRAGIQDESSDPRSDFDT